MNQNGSPQIYHEKQVKEMCALHALNNLFQVPGAFSKSDLDSICSSLSPNAWINPHRSVLGLGNYDVNVIMSALQRKGREAVWFDKRKDPRCLDLTNICGFILNVPSEYKLGFVSLPLRRRHWIAVRQIHGHFYNLDSKLDAPHLIGRGSDLIPYLKEQLESEERELFVVVSREVEQRQMWRREDTRAPSLPASNRSSGVHLYCPDTPLSECLHFGDIAGKIGQSGGRNGKYGGHNGQSGQHIQNFLSSREGVFQDSRFQIQQ